MPTPITDVLVVNWANQRARPLADKLVSLYYSLLSYQNDYAAAGIGAAITADLTTGNIVDGSATDGRTPITGTSLVNLAAAISQVMTAINVTLVTGVGATVVSVSNGIQVNGSPK